MKTNVSRFSLSAYEDLRDAGELSKQERIVFNTVVEHGPMTREEIEAFSGLRLASVCGRVNSLLKKGVFLETGERKNPITGKLNGILDLSLAEITGNESPTNTHSAASQQVASDVRQQERA